MNWTQLVYEGERDGRQWESWESMLNGISLVLHEGAYRSPAPEGKLIECMQASARCLEQQYVYTIPGRRGDFCRAPAGRECPYKTPSKVSALAPQRSKALQGRATPPVQEGKSKRIKAWILWNLGYLTVVDNQKGPFSHAAQVQLGLDEPVTLDELKALGQEMVRRYYEQMPHKA